MQQANLYEPLEAMGNAPAPLVIRAVVPTQVNMLVGGVPASSKKLEHYILLSALPEELRHRVEIAIQSLMSGA